MPYHYAKSFIICFNSRQDISILSSPILIAYSLQRLTQATPKQYNEACLIYIKYLDTGH